MIPGTINNTLHKSVYTVIKVVTFIDLNTLLFRNPSNNSPIVVDSFSLNAM